MVDDDTDQGEAKIRLAELARARAYLVEALARVDNLLGNVTMVAQHDPGWDERRAWECAKAAWLVLDDLP